MMTSTLEMVARAAPDRRPFWGIALLYPDQGTWSEEEYLDLPGNSAEIEVLTLQGGAYVTAGRYRAGEQLKSLLFSDFSLDVAKVFEGD